MTNFKYFSPLQRLNAGLFKAKIFESEPKINLFGGRRYHRFAACNESFRDNILALNYSLRRIGEHYQLLYTKEDRTGANQRFIQNTIILAIDLESYLLKVKEVLDCVAFFIPFYYKDSLRPRVHGMPMDARDLNDPWAFRSMKKYFIDGRIEDEEFRKILIEHSDWTEDILWKRDILQHKFHRLSVSQDHWTSSCYVYFYEFNKIRDFIPNILFYVSSIHFKLVRFLNAIENHFKVRCTREISGYQYFNEGSSFVDKMDKVHYFFISLGRFLDGKILIRIHPDRRREIEIYLNQILADLNIKCSKCKQHIVKIKPTTESFVLISVFCQCGNQIPLKSSVLKRFFPYFFDRNQNYWDLIPNYKITDKITF